MWWIHRRMTRAAGAVVVIAGLVTGLLLASCSAPPRPAPRHAATPVATPTPRATGPLTSPFTGERVKSLRRVLVVKIDNYVLARPATGLGKADIVYVLPVEGGLSRLMAIFSSHIPSVIGPVRSARADDLALLHQFGRPAFAYSGATPVLLPYIHRHARIFDLYAGTHGGYFRSNNRIAPYNLYARTRQLLAQAPHASKARDIGYRFGAPPAGGHHVRSESVSYPAASFRFTWSARKQRWLISMDGKPATATDTGRLGAATVVIQHTRVRTSSFLEYGQPPPYAESTGSGPATVLRNGMAYRAHWSRRNRGRGTTFTTRSGQPMTFARGPVWVVLAYR